MNSLASFAFSIDNENPFVNKRFIAKQKSMFEDAAFVFDAFT